MAHIGIVAGESSGDRLGAALVLALRERCPEIRITAMAGPAMRAAGCEAIARTEELSVMGLVEVVKKYPELRRLRERLVRYYLQSRPDVFVGIDVPDFVMNIEARLHRAGLKTVHYVAPQVWAWRQHRARRLAERLDRLFTLFPFEVDFFARYGVATEFVGHPLADNIPLDRDPTVARGELELSANERYVALMPGSRNQELQRHTGLFLDAAAEISREFRHIGFVAGAIDASAAEMIERIAHREHPQLRLKIVVGDSLTVLRACDAALVASGTVTLEGLFLKTPMVVAYKLAPLTFAILKRMVKVPHIALPNVLAGYKLIPEFVQGAAEPRALAEAVIDWLQNDDKVNRYEAKCREIHAILRCGGAARAAREILELAGVEED